MRILQMQVTVAWPRMKVRAVARSWQLRRAAGLATVASTAEQGKNLVYNAINCISTHPPTPGKMVLGCGSNVVDHIYRVKGQHHSYRSSLLNVAA